MREETVIHLHEQKHDGKGTFRHFGSVSFLLSVSLIEWENHHESFFKLTN